MTRQCRCAPGSPRPRSPLHRCQGQRHGCASGAAKQRPGGYTCIFKVSLDIIKYDYIISLHIMGDCLCIKHMYVYVSICVWCTCTCMCMCMCMYICMCILHFHHLLSVSIHMITLYIHINIHITHVHLPIRVSI